MCKVIFETLCKHSFILDSQQSNKVGTIIIVPKETEALRAIFPKPHGWQEVELDQLGTGDIGGQEREAACPDEVDILVSKPDKKQASIEIHKIIADCDQCFERNKQSAEMKTKAAS